MKVCIKCNIRKKNECFEMKGWRNRKDTCKQCLMKTCDTCHYYLSDNKFYKYNQITCKKCLLNQDKNIDMNDLKKCKKCNQEKQITYFKINKKGKIGVTCEECLEIAKLDLKNKREKEHQEMQEYFNSREYQMYGSDRDFLYDDSDDYYDNDTIL